ncbi:hypothetical protein SXCC_04666 [Gluconacetobacter sp. SXCC-1]|nr:hypothetical protein SXCC_04666 [Gluconacetobacter sp. SXCC-1]
MLFFCKHTTCPFAGAMTPQHACGGTNQKPVSMFYIGSTRRVNRL